MAVKENHARDSCLTVDGKPHDAAALAHTRANFRARELASRHWLTDKHIARKLLAKLALYIYIHACKR